MLKAKDKEARRGNLITFAMQFVFFLLFVAYFALRGAEIRPNLWILAFPLLLLIMAGLGLGLGVLISALTTKYRDLRFLVSFGVSLLMYATPVIYPASAVPARFQLFIQLNPVTSLIETFRYGFLGSGTVNPWGLLYSFVFMLITVVLGAVVFNRVEATFMDTV